MKQLVKYRRPTLDKVKTMNMGELVPNRVHPPQQCSTSEGPLQFVKLLGLIRKWIDVLKSSQRMGH